MSSRVSRLFWTGVVGFSLSLPLQAQESPSYIMERISLASGGTAMSGSERFAGTVLVAEAAPSRASSHCNARFVNSLGFWSVLETEPVRIALTVRRHPLIPDGIDLTWTGANKQFGIYRSFSPFDVLDPSNLYREAYGCSATDANASGSNTIFYMVVPRE